MPTRQQLESALVNADKAGDVDAARQLANAIKAMKPEDSLLDNALDVAGEFAAGANRTLMWPVDTAVSAVNMIPGVDLPKPSSKLPGIEGNFMEEGMARDAVRAGGEVLGPGGMAMAPVKGRNLAKPAQAAAEFAGMGSATPTAVAGNIPQSIQDKVSRELALKNQTGDVAQAGFRLDGDEAVKDPIQQQLMKLGVKDSVLAQITSSSPKTKYRLNQALSILEQGRKNERFANTNRPLDAAGQSVMDRVRFVTDKNREAASKLDSVAASLKGQRVDVTQPVTEFLTDLKSYGVTMGDDFKVSLQNSDFEGGDAVEAIFDRVIKRMAHTNTPDAYDVHRLKKFIDNQVDMGKSKEGWSGQAERVVKKLRHNLDSLLDQQFPEYNQVNTQYADTRQAIESLQDIAGKRIDLSGNNADAAIGTLTRRLLSNAQSRVPLMDAVEGLDQVSGKYGAQFDDDVISQVSFVNELERLMGASGYTSFQGDIAKATQDTARAMRGDTTGLMDSVIGKATEKLRKTPEQKQTEIIQNLRELLNQAKP